MKAAGIPVMVKRYLTEYFSEVEHPAEPFNASRRFVLVDIETIVEALVELLRSPTPVSKAEDLESQVRFAINEYVSAPVLDFQRRSSAVGHLAERLEPFLKKLFAMRHPTASIPDSLRTLLKDVAGYQDELLFRPTDEELIKKLMRQRTEEAVFHDAYYFRNKWAHEAPSLTPFEQQRYWISVVAAFLLTAMRNIDLVPAVERHADNMERICSGLKICLDNARTRVDDTRWRNEFYIPLGAEQGGQLDKHIEAFLGSQTCKLLTVTGRTGAGKSTFLERLTTELAARALDVLGVQIESHLLVPVHLELKRYTPSKRIHLAKKLYSEFDPNRALGIKSRKIASWPLSLSPAYLVACLDGLDEVDASTYPAVVSEIEELVASFDNLKVVVTSRPHAVPEHWRKSEVSIAPLPFDEVLAYFGHPQRLNLLAPHVQAFLEVRPDFVEILQDPLMTEAACRYWHQFEPSQSETNLEPDVWQEALSEGPLLDHLYRSFFTHHLRRALRKQVPDYERARQVNALAKLALKMDGDPTANFELVTSAFVEFETGASSDHRLLELFMDLGLLQSENGEFTFRNDTVKAYFAAIGLRSHMRRPLDLDEVLSFIRQADQFWYKCVGLLRQIAPLHDLSHIEGHLTSLAEV